MITSGRRKGELTFIFNSYPEAGRVFLAGDFNGWDPADRRMTRRKDGTFRARVMLAPGRYEYKFVADGKWLTDPDAPEQVANAFGTINGLVCVD